MRLSFLVCHRVFQTLDKHNTRQLAVEQIRGGLNIRPQYHDLPQPQRTEQFQKNSKTKAIISGETVRPFCPIQRHASSCASDLESNVNRTE